MPREKEFYRPYLERLDEKFPDKEIISQKEFAAYVGWSTKKARRNGIDGKGISKVRMANFLANL